MKEEEEEEEEEKDKGIRKQKQRGDERMCENCRGWMERAAKITVENEED